MQFLQSLHHRPVIGAGTVHLERMFGPGLNHDVHDQERFAGAQFLVVTPRAVNAFVHQVLVALHGFEEVDDLIDRPRAVLMCDQYGIRGFHDDQIFDAGRRAQSAFCTHVTITGTVGVCVSQNYVAGRIRLPRLRKRFPGTDVAPADVGLDDIGVVGFSIFLWSIESDGEATRILPLD